MLKLIRDVPYSDLFQNGVKITKWSELSAEYEIPFEKSGNFNVYGKLSNLSPLSEYTDGDMFLEYVSDLLEHIFPTIITSVNAFTKNYGSPYESIGYSITLKGLDNEETHWNSAKDDMVYTVSTLNSIMKLLKYAVEVNISDDDVRNSNGMYLKNYQTGKVYKMPLISVEGWAFDMTPEVITEAIYKGIICDTLTLRLQKDHMQSELYENQKMIMKNRICEFLWDFAEKNLKISVLKPKNTEANI